MIGSGNAEAGPPIMARINGFSKLEHDWDSDGAFAPNQEAIEIARMLVRDMATIPDDIGPDAIGGVALMFCRFGAEVSVYLWNSGARLLSISRSGKTEVKNYPDVEALRQALTEALCSKIR